MNNDEISKIKALVDGMSYREFVELCYSFFERKVDEDTTEEYGRRVYATPLIFEVAYHERDGFVGGRFVAKPEPDYYGYIGDDLCQSGTCFKCRSECTGFSKSSICPVCGSLVEMT